MTDSKSLIERKKPSKKQTAKREPAQLQSEKQVELFLTNNPTFLRERPDLLSKIDIPHNTQGVASLIERQVQVLRSHTSELEQRLNSLFQVAEQNNRLYELSMALTLKLMAAKGLSELVELCYQGLRDDLQGDLVRIHLFKKSADKALKDPVNNYLRFHVATQTKHLYQDLLDHSNCYCGRLSTQQISTLFDEGRFGVGSALIAGITKCNSKSKKALMGLLVIGSRSASHFHSELNTSFITHIANVFSIALQQHI